MAETDHGTEQDDDEDRPHWFGLLVPALTFLVGLVLGGVLVYANNSGDTEDGAETEPSEAPSESSGAGDTVVTLPAACEEASRGVTEGYRLLRQALDQVRDFQAGDLVETLDKLQTVDEDTRPLVRQCSEVSVDTSPTPTPSPTPAEPSETTEP